MFKETIGGHSDYRKSFMCESCYNTIEFDSDVFINIGFTNPKKISKELKSCITYNVEFHISCPLCDDSMISVDSGILNAISTLNKKGYLTIDCQEGHYAPYNTYVYFSNVCVLPSIPEGFSAGSNPNLIRVSQKADTEDQRKIYIDNLNKWANELPIYERTTPTIMFPNWMKKKEGGQS